MGLALIDLDHFKAVNDTQGHPAGDRVLAAVGAALHRVARAHDTAARVGGDEFALVLTDCEAEDAAVAAERVVAVVAATVGQDGVTASVGVATAPEDGRTGGELVRAADGALYAAKAAGRNRWMTSERPAATAPPLLVLDGAGRRHPRRLADLEALVMLPAASEELS